MSLREDAAELQPELAALRRELHQIPEIGLDLPKTQERVLSALHPFAARDLHRHRTVIDHSSVAWWANQARSYCWRGDMDGFAGHRELGRDVHVAPRRCNARVRTTTCTPRDSSARHSCSRRGRADLAGDIVFMFQPGEERLGRCRSHDHRGAFSTPPVGPSTRRTGPARPVVGHRARSVRIPSGSPDGPRSDGLFVKVIGAGGHGSRPARRPRPGAGGM